MELSNKTRHLSHISKAAVSIVILNDADVRAFHDVEFSLDYPTEAEQEAQRGPGNWELIHEQPRVASKLEVPVTITAVMMNANYSRLADVAINQVAANRWFC